MTTTICTHSRAYTGLDSCYCPECKKTFAQGSATYNQIVNRVPRSNSVLGEGNSFNIEVLLELNKPLDVVSSTTNDAKSSRGCTHTLVPVWTDQIQLQSFCTRCSYSEPVRDPAVLQSTYQSVESVLNEYQQALAQADSQARKREFEGAIATKNSSLNTSQQF